MSLDGICFRFPSPTAMLHTAAGTSQHQVKNHFFNSCSYHEQFISALRWLKNILAFISRWRHRGVTLASGWWRRSINPASLLSDPTFTFTFILHWYHSIGLHKRRIWPLNTPRAGSQLKLMLWPNLTSLYDLILSHCNSTY